MHGMLELVRRLYPLRNCNLNLTEENIQKKKFKKCLEYHLGNCLGPCEGLQSKEDYDNSIINIRQIIKGNIQGSIRFLKEEIEKYAANLEFEKAHELKEKMEMLEKYQSKSMVVSPTIDNVDVFSIITDEKCGYVNYLKVMNGAIVQSHTIELNKKLEETPEELLLLGIAELRLRFESHSPEIIIPFDTEAEVPDATFFVPQKTFGIIGKQPAVLYKGKGNAGKP
jgi:excinuclease ABC subunit C